MFFFWFPTGIIPFFSNSIQHFEHGLNETITWHNSTVKFLRRLGVDGDDEKLLRLM